MIELERRKIHTAALLENLTSRIEKAQTLAAGGQACVYATGSVGRCEAGNHSDIDLVIVTQGLVKSIQNGDREEETEDSCLTLLDEICLKANIIDAMRDLGLTDLDGQGKYFRKYAILQLINSIGEQHDDWENTLSSRLLLLLESKPILGAQIHEEAIDRILDSYWSDYDGHEKDYVPAFFTNDILRLWRTFCVNYEARTRTLPAERKMERRIKNLKLKYSRMLTCYSAIIFLLDHYNRERTVTRNVAKEMSLLTPVERLVHVKEQAPDGKGASCIEDVIRRYDAFLAETDKPKSDLTDYMKTHFDRMRSDAHIFGDKIFDAMEAVSGNNRFYRMIVV